MEGIRNAADRRGTLRLRVVGGLVTSFVAGLPLIGIGLLALLASRLGY